MSDKSVVNCTVIVEEFIVNIYSSPIFFELEIKLCLKSIISLSNNLFNNPAFWGYWMVQKLTNRFALNLKNIVLSAINYYLVKETSTALKFKLWEVDIALTFQRPSSSLKAHSDVPTKSCRVHRWPARGLQMFHAVEIEIQDTTSGCK